MLIVIDRCKSNSVSPIRQLEYGNIAELLTCLIVFPNVRYRGIAVDNGVRHIEIYFKGRVAITWLNTNKGINNMDDNLNSIS